MINEVQKLHDYKCLFHSFIPLAYAECNNSLPFSGASSIPLCCVHVPTILPSSLTSSCHLFLGLPLNLLVPKFIYRVSHELRSLLQESVPYVKLYRYNPKHLYPKLNGYGDNGKRSLTVWQLLHTY